MTFLLLAAMLAIETEKPFAITVVDADTGRGVPLVELRTVNHLRFVTDSNGVVAFHEPGLMAEGVFFHVSGHGYEFPQDGFGNRGTKIQIAPGGSATLKIQRMNVAERLYRVTGAGIYRDSLLVGRAVPLKEPVLNGKVFGSDSVMSAEYRGKMYWFWGDTNLPNYPLGNFHVTGATSEIPGHGGLDPSLGVELSYFLDKNGAAKKMAELPGKGPTWIESLVPLADADGRERLYAAYVKIEPPLTTVARGVAVFDDEKWQFEKLADIPLTAAAYPHGHAFRHRDQGRDFIYFAHPFPLTRVPAMASAFADASAYQAYTCLKEGSRLDAPQIDRHADGRPRYSWKTDTPVVGPVEQAKLIADGKLKAADALLQLRDRDTGRAVTAHSGSVSWNEYRKRWVLIAVESGGGPSYLGEVWYAEADTLMGPWAYAEKVVTHDKYSFYNPKQHPTFAKDGGRTIFFEGTYTRDFSGNPDATPRYEYNQVMYRLNLSDARLKAVRESRQ